MKLVNIGGVPEHFNLPWYLTLRDGQYKKKGINLRWKDYHGGTGEMAKALRNNEIDLAVVLTEGIVKDIIAGNQCKIVQVFVKSPLIWGIHVAHNSIYQTVEDLIATKAAISRYGSGSHLMAYINAKNKGWNLNTDLNFEVVKTLDGAVETLSNQRADYFMWEKFTTKPLVDNGTFRRIDDCPTPWPCFVIAVRNEFIEQNEDMLKTILDIINRATSDFKEIPNIADIIANRYNQRLMDVEEWLDLTEWSQEQINFKTLSKVQNELFSLEIIDKKISFEEITYSL